jgi:2-amino-4-hydroxy-6-hydroxymethyldihydropteridine diphosphokinase
MKNIAIVGIGSNLGDKIKNCESAIDRLGRFRENRILQRSSLYKTEPMGYTAQDWFVNGVIKVETRWGPHALLGCLKRLERALGRRKTWPWGPRVIDLDLLLFNREEIQTKDVQIPHPHLHERAFVLVPLCEIDPEAVHPVLRKRAKELLKDLGEITGVEKI